MNKGQKLLFIIGKIFSVIGYLLVWKYSNGYTALGLFFALWSADIRNYLRLRYSIGSLGTEMKENK